ncbi:succinyl ligase subunit beta [Fusarium coicis]|nr:succinyl ligase subunit beta [Fusarium coicis]
MALRFRSELRNIPLFLNTLNVPIVTQLLRSLAKGMPDSDKMSTYTRISVTEAHEKNHRDLTIPVYMEKVVEHEEKWRLTMAVDRERCRPIIEIRDAKSHKGLPHVVYEAAFQEVFEFSLSTGITEELLTDIAQSFHLGKASNLYGGSSANFLDAGGQATKETMLQAFKIIMSDKRVKAILVNIYGGITRCDMIAESIIAAASELGPLKVPMVVRLQGTNSEAGLQLLKDATLDIHVEADFGKAAQDPSQVG